MWIRNTKVMEESCSRWERAPLTEEVGAVLVVDTIGLGKGRITRLAGTDDMGGGTCLTGQGEPNPMSQTRRVCARIPVVICHFPGGRCPILSVAKVIMGVVARDCMEGIVGTEPLIKVTCRWHLFPIHVALAAPKDINIELCLEAWRSWTLGLLNG